MAKSWRRSGHVLDRAKLNLDLISFSPLPSYANLKNEIVVLVFRYQYNDIDCVLNGSAAPIYRTAVKFLRSLAIPAARNISKSWLTKPGNG